MHKIHRRELLQRAGMIALGAALQGKLAGATGTGIPAEPLSAAPPHFAYGVARSLAGVSSVLKPPFEWIRSVRLMIAEGYCPPFYPSLDYEPERALTIAQRLNCDSFRFPTFSYVAYFPTQTKLPHHPQLGSSDPFRHTIDLFHGAALKVVAYNPLNHPFMDVHSGNPEYADWRRCDADGKPYVTRHMGWTQFYEGCLNSPLRAEVKQRVKEVVTDYPVDLMYFDGPYEGMDHRLDYCYCRHCKAAYQKARGNSIPLHNPAQALEEDIEYERWMAEDVVSAFMQEICEMVRQVRDVPIIYNDTSLLSHDVRQRLYRYTDGFMFEAAETPEEKLFNLRLGQSTGKVIWTYISSHTEYNSEHLKDKTVRGWYSSAPEGERLQLDAAVATAAGAGYCYWGLNRLFYSTEDILNQPWLRGLKQVFDFAQHNERLLRSVHPVPQVGILVGTQTISWWQSDMFVAHSYRNYYDGAFQLLKDLAYDAEPFLDFETTPERLAKYQLVYVPNAPCLSEAQCAMLAGFVAGGGTLVATHMTSVADEYGRVRRNYGLSEFLGGNFRSAEPVEVPDLYLRILSSGELIPQDPQVMLFDAAGSSEVIAETYDRGHRHTLCPAVISRRYGKGRAVYIGSGLEAVYDETLNRSIRDYFQSLFAPVLTALRGYEMEYRAGLMTQLAISSDVLLLHLIANTGNIWKKLLVEEDYLPLSDVKVRLRLPAGRTAKSVGLMWSGRKPAWRVENGWVAATVPDVHPYEAVYVELGA